MDIKIKRRTVLYSVMLTAGMIASPSLAAPIWDLNAQESFSTDLFITHGGNENVNIVGDLDNDGYDDIVVSRHIGKGNREVKHNIIYGSPDRDKDTTLNKATDASFNTGLMRSDELFDVVGADMNGDSYDDLVVADRTGLYVIFGSATRLSGQNEFSEMNRAQISETVEYSYVVEVVDLLNDGTDALVVRNNNNGDAWVAFSSSTYNSGSTILFDSSPFPFRIEATLDPINKSARIVGDLNNDGYIDWLRSNVDQWELYYGSDELYMTSAYFDTEFHLTPDVVFPSAILTSSRHSKAKAVSSSIFGYSDVNKDGIDDLAFLVNYTADDYYGGYSDLGQDLIILYGEHEGYSKGITGSNFSQFNLDSMGSLRHIGYGMWKSGDVNGDGSDDTSLMSVVSGDLRLYTFVDKIPKNRKSINALIQRSFNTNGYITASNTQVGDIDGDGFDDTLISDGYVRIIYGKPNFKGAEALIQNISFHRGGKVRVVRRDGTFFNSKPLRGMASKKLVGEQLPSNTHAIVVSKNGKVAGGVSTSKSNRVSGVHLSDTPQNMVRIESFALHGDKRQEAIIFTKAGGVITLYYVVLKKNKLKVIDSQQVQATTKKFWPNVSSSSDGLEVTVYDDDRINLGTFRITKSALLVR